MYYLFLVKIDAEPILQVVETQQAFQKQYGKQYTN